MAENEKPANRGQERSAEAHKANDERKASKDATKDEKQVQDLVDQETEQGFRGVEVDTTDNEVYTVTGDSSQAPEAQADPAQAMKDASNPDR